MPNWAILYYLLRLYFLYGMFYFGYLYLDRIIGWSTSEQPLPYIVWFRTAYELGMDWALISLIFSIALLEYTINEFASLIIPTQKTYSAFDVQKHNAYFRRFFLCQIVLLILIAVVSIVVVYLAVGSLRQHQHVKAAATPAPAFTPAPTPILPTFLDTLPLRLETVNEVYWTAPEGGDGPLEYRLEEGLVSLSVPELATVGLVTIRWSE